MEKATEQFEKSIAAALDLEAAKDHLFAESLKKEGKSMTECFGGYAELMFTDGSIVVTAITDIQHLLEEGEVMHHCVGTYYNEFDSLILSAKDTSGERIATIEWSISEGRVLQCKGKYNSVPDKYDEILKLIDTNKKKLHAAV